MHGLACGATDCLTRGCWETETEKRSCHSFTLPLLGVGLRRTGPHAAGALTHSDKHTFPLHVYLSFITFVCSVHLILTFLFWSSFFSPSFFLSFFLSAFQALPPGEFNLWPLLPWQRCHMLYRKNILYYIKTYFIVYLKTLIMPLICWFTQYLSFIKNISFHKSDWKNIPFVIVLIYLILAG